MERSSVWWTEFQDRMPRIEAAETEEERVEFLQRLNDTLARMPEPRRNMVLLARIEHWTYGEIAAAYQVGPGRVRREIRRAMFQLRRRTRPQDFSLWARIKPMWMS